MIEKILTHYADQLEDYLREYFPQPEGCVEVSLINNSDESKKNKLLISLLSIERDSAMGITAIRKNHRNNGSVNFPPLYMNINLILAAVYDEKRYRYALSILSATLLFLQSMPSFTFDKKTYSIEIISPTSQELNNIWASMGGQYYPSVVCKLKGVTFDAEEIKLTHGQIRRVAFKGM